MSYNIELNYYNGSAYQVLYPKVNLQNTIGTLDYSKLENIPISSSGIVFEKIQYTGTGMGAAKCTVNQVFDPFLIFVTTTTGSLFNPSPGGVGIFFRSAEIEGTNRLYKYNYYYSMLDDEIVFYKTECQYVYSTVTGNKGGTITFSHKLALYPNLSPNINELKGCFNVSGQKYYVGLIGRSSII